MRNADVNEIGACCNLPNMKTNYDESSPCLLYRFEMGDSFDDEIFLSTARNLLALSAK